MSPLNVDCAFTIVPNYVFSLMLCGLFVIAPFSALNGQNAFERGKSFYEQRAALADSFRAKPANINKAIEAFTKSLSQNVDDEESAAHLLRAYYFKGMFTDISDDQKKKVYDKGRDLGKKMLDRFPDSVPIKFWYGANIGKWADLHGFVKAATSGVAPKLRRVCKEIIRLDPQYQGGGGYRILAQVHFHSPSIPILMGWPSKEKALELVREAIEIAPEHPANRMLYAQLLLEFDRTEEAQKQLKHILDMEPRSTHPVEDAYIKYRSRGLLDEHF